MRVKATLPEVVKYSSTLTGFYFFSCPQMRLEDLLEENFFSFKSQFVNDF